MRSSLRHVAVLAVLGGAVLAGCLQDAPASTQEIPTPTEPVLALSPEINDLLATIDAALAGNGTLTLEARPVYDGTSVIGKVAAQPGQGFEVELWPSPALAEEVWAQVDDAFVDLPFVRVFEGHVVGDEDQLVRLTVASQWARGSIRTDDIAYLVRIGLEGNLPAEATGARAMAPIGPAPLDYDPPGWVEHDCLYLASTTIKPVVEIGRSAQAELVAELILDADQQFHDALGEDTFPMMVAMAMESDAIYDHEVGIRFSIVGLHLNSDPAYFPSPGDQPPLKALAEYWNARNVSRDVVHLFTGQESSFAMANCIGGAGIPELAYTFTPLNWARDYEVFHTTAVAHELGHIFSAHHHYGNHAEAGGDLATLMIQGYTPGSNPVFSTVSKSHIRGWSEAHVV